MKICIVQAWGFEKLDGSNLRVYFLVKELVKKRNEVIVIHSSNADAEYTKKIIGCKAYDVDMQINRWESYRKKIIKYILFVWRATKLAKKIDCDVIFGISLINAMVAVSHKNAQAAILYVDFMSNYYQYAHHKGLIHWVLYRLGKFLEHYTIRKSSKVIIITNALRNLVPDKYWHKITIVPDGADTKKFVPIKVNTEIKESFGLKPDDIVIGYQGGIEPHDGLQFVAEIASKVVKMIPQVKFLIAGQGSYLEKVKDILVKNGAIDKFIFTGWLDSSRIPYVMAVTDLNVVPIPNHPATSPLITFRLLESMAAGVNVIVNDLPGIREVVDESMAFFTDIENPEKFVQDIISALKTPLSIRNEMKIKARKKVEKMDWRRIASLDADYIKRKVVV